MPLVGVNRQDDSVTDLLDYEDHHATVADAIRYATSGVQSPTAAAGEALARLVSGTRPLPLPDDIDQDRLREAIASAVERGANGELSDHKAAHAVLDAMRGLGVPIGPRPPDDPFTDL